MENGHPSGLKKGDTILWSRRRTIQYRNNIMEEHEAIIDVMKSKYAEIIVKSNGMRVKQAWYEDMKKIG